MDDIELKIRKGNREKCLSDDESLQSLFDKGLWVKNEADIQTRRGLGLKD